MAQLDAAADSLIAFAAKFRPVLDVADALKSLGSVENAIVERKAGLERATADHEAALAKVEAAKADLANIAQTKESEMSAHVTMLAAMAEKAKSEAEAIVNKAKADAAALISDAQAHVCTIEDNHATIMASANAELTSTKQSLSEAQSALAAVNAEHDTVSQRIAALKAAAASVLA